MDKATNEQEKNDYTKTWIVQKRYKDKLNSARSEKINSKGLRHNLDERENETLFDISPEFHIDFSLILYICIHLFIFIRDINIHLGILL